LPQPALPQISVSRPLGNPPPVISSSPWIPVGAFGNWGLDFAGLNFAGRDLARVDGVILDIAILHFLLYDV